VWEKHGPPGLPGTLAEYGLFEQSKGKFRLMAPSENPHAVKKLWAPSEIDSNKFVLRKKVIVAPEAKTGYLTKQGHFIKNWKKRWYRMENGVMLYFRNQKDKQAAGCVNLKGATLSLANEKISKKNCLQILNADGGSHFAFAGSKEELDSWMTSVQAMIEFTAISDLEILGVEVSSAGPASAAGSADKGKASAAADDGVARKMTIEDFELIKVLGKGSFGKVMLGKKKGDEKLFAIKILKKEMVLENEELEHTRTERNVLQSAEHPFLVRMYYSFQTADRLYFVMDYINGGELFYHMQREGKFSEERSKFYTAEIVCGLTYLHKRGVVYRDLKLENLLLDNEGHILLTDFGLCKENIGQGATTSTFCGTPEYLAPEVVEDEDYGTPVDWWSLGVVLYEMITGRSPFSSSDHEELFRQILTAEIYYPSSLSAGAKDILQALLQRDPKLRLGSGPGDGDEIKAHHFFSNIDFVKLEKREVRPPFVPKVDGAGDTTNFDPMFTSEPAILTPAQPSALTTQDQANFGGFTYVAGSKLAS